MDRCLIVLQHPIIPWPAYEDGESVDLTGIFQATIANAEL